MRLGSIQNAALSVGALAGSLCLVAALVSVLFGIKPLMFKSGSMEPNIPTGGLALSIPVHADEIRVGDIVSTENSTGTRITHRVAAITPADGYAQLVLKGDANDIADAEIYPVSTVDRVFWSVPVLGYAVAGLTSPVALFLGGLLTAYLLYIAFAPGSPARSNERRTPGPSIPASGRRVRRSGRRRRGHSLRRATGVTVAGTLIVTGGALAGGSPARAQFSDSASAAGKLAAGKLSTPHSPACKLAGGLLGIGDGIVLSWSYSGIVPVTGYALSVDGSAGTTKTASTDLPARDATVVIRASKENWRSDPLTVFVDYSAGVLGVGASVTCTVL